MFVASIGFAIGLDADWFRHFAAILLIALGALELTGFDRSVEAALVNTSPGWFTTLTTRF